MISCVLTVVLLSHIADGHLAANPIYRQLVETGMGPEFGFAQPMLADDLSPSSREAVIADVIPREQREQFFRESVVAPQQVNMSRTEGVSHLGIEGSIRRVDFWYIAYGDFEALASDEFLQLLGGEFEENDSGQVVDDRQLAARGLESRQDFERLAFGKYELMKKVQLRGVVRSAWSQTPQSIVAASILDPRFLNDEKLGNTWSPLTRNEVGELVEGAPTAYDGAGGYLKLTPLNQSDGAIFVEGHVAFFEPTAWFNGANLLGSKLPAIIQQNVRRTRNAILRVSRQPAD